MLALTIDPGVAVVPTAAVVAAAALAVSGGLLLAARRALVPTTLVAAWAWALAAAAGWSAAEFVVAWLLPAAPSWTGPVRYAAVGLSLCPVIAVIGAKRPQHSAWSLVVLSLWAIVALPAAEAVALGRGLQIGAARGWFLWILVLLGPINYVPTRYWLAAVLVAAGQVLALSPWLPLVRRALVSQPQLSGLALATLGLLAAWAVARPPPQAGGYDRLWRDFRDGFGLFWALRVQERVNALAGQHGWDLELRWAGFCRRSDGAALAAVPPEIEPTLRTSLKGLLRRFVTAEWIAARLEQRAAA